MRFKISRRLENCIGKMKGLCNKLSQKDSHCLIEKFSLTLQIQSRCSTPHGMFAVAIVADTCAIAFSSLGL